jgi:hypothetical protein
MEISGKLTAEQARELRSFVLTGFARYSSFGLGELLAAMVAMIAIRVSLDLQRSGVFLLVWTVCAGAFAAAIWLRRKRRRNELQMFLEARPESYRVDDHGVLARYDTGIEVFTPWSFFASYRAFGSLLLFDSKEQKNILVMSVSPNAQPTEQVLLLVSSKLRNS